MGLTHGVRRWSELCSTKFTYWIKSSHFDRQGVVQLGHLLTIWLQGLTKHWLLQMYNSPWKTGWLEVSFLTFSYFISWQTSIKLFFYSDSMWPPQHSNPDPLGLSFIIQSIMYSNVKLVTYILYDKKILRFPVILTNLQHYSSSLGCRMNIYPFPWKAHEFQDSKVNGNQYFSMGQPSKKQKKKGLSP